MSSLSYHSLMNISRSTRPGLLDRESCTAQAGLRESWTRTGLLGAVGNGTDLPDCCAKKKTLFLLGRNRLVASDSQGLRAGLMSQSRAPHAGDFRAISCSSSRSLCQAKAGAELASSPSQWSRSLAPVPHPRPYCRSRRAGSTVCFRGEP